MKRYLFLFLLSGFCFAGLTQAKNLIPEDGLRIYTLSLHPNNKARMAIDIKLSDQASASHKAVVEIWQDDRRLFSKAKNLKPGAEAHIETNLKNCQPWSVQNQSLYRLRLTLYAGQQAVEQCETSFGIRTVKVIANEGIYLNTNPIRLYGIRWPVQEEWLQHTTISAEKAIISRLQDMGCNALCFPAHELTESRLDLADQTGMLLMADLSEVSEENMSKEIVRLRNRPSVIMWLVGNQSLQRNTDAEIEQMTERAKTIRKLDPSRLLTAGLKQLNDPIKKGLISQLDIAGLDDCSLRYQEAYNKTEQHLVIATRTLINNDDERKAFPTLPWVTGQFLQTNLVPFITQTDTFYLYRSLWNKQNHTLHIASHWNHTDGSYVITPVYSDLQDVELKVNENSLGKDTTHIWQVPFQEGELKAIAYLNGKEVQRTIQKTANNPVHVDLIPFFAGNMSFITTRITDDQNITCPQNQTPILVEWDGTGSVLGYMTANRYFPLQGKQNLIRLQDGTCTLVIDGNGILSVKADNLIGGRLQINHNR